MNDIQLQFLQTINPSFFQPAGSLYPVGQTYTIYLTNNKTIPVSLSEPLQPLPALGEIFLGLGLGMALFGGVVVVAEILNGLFTPLRNDEPMSAAMRRYIRERDDEICLYCEEYAPNGHVDHRVSRANGGSNDSENLTWACVSCNCSKGALNDAEFIMLMES